jgi:hypothetical protein
VKKSCTQISELSKSQEVMRNLMDVVAHLNYQYTFSQHAII